MRMPPALRRIGVALSLLCLSVPAGAEEAPTLRVAIVGGIVMSGVWDKLIPAIESATGVHIDTVRAAPKGEVVPAFRSGEAELLLIHASDETSFLLADGMAAPLRAWAMNEHVLVGPADDPADIAHARDGADALARIVRADAPLLLFRDPGSFSIVQGLLKRAGVRPGMRQQGYDDAPRPQQVLEAAARQQAYVMVGALPVAFGKMPNPGLKVLYRGDPAMRRLYVVVEPGPAHPATAAQRMRARLVADYLTRAAGQAALVAADQAAGGPWIYPLPAAAVPAAPVSTTQEDSKHDNNN